MQNIAMGKDAAYVFSLLFMLCFLRSTLIAIQTSTSAKPSPFFIVLSKMSPSKGK